MLRWRRLIGLTKAELGGRRGILNAQPGIFVGELDAVTHAKINVDVGDMGDVLIAVKKRHVANVDFPIERARRARIVGVIGRTTLG